MVEARLQVLKQLDHELLVGVVVPAPVRLFEFPGGVLADQTEVRLEEVKEILEEEVLVDVSADVLGEFLHEAHVLLGLNGVVLVVLPVVLEVLLEPLGHLLAEGSVLVEVSK